MIQHKIKQLIVSVVMTLLITITCSYAAEDANPVAMQLNPHATPLIVPSPPDLNAEAYVLIDANSGKIIAAKNANEHRPPASLTKLMTLYLTFGALKQNQIHLDDNVRISTEAWQQGGSRMFIKPNTLVPVEQLIQGVIVASGNDACYALAQYVGGNEQTFVQYMNQAAHNLGMNNSHFMDCNGLPHPEHYSTAADLAALTRAIIQDYPSYYHYFDQKWLTYNHIKQANRNRLLWRDPSVDGLKTGHTNAAGYCLIASSQRDGMRLIAVTMGAPNDNSRAVDSEALLNYGFRFYKTQLLFNANQTLTNARVWMGQNKNVPLGLPQDLYVTVAKGQLDKVKANMVLNPNLTAPIKKDEIIGKVVVSLADKTIATAPLVALSADPEGGFFSRLSDHVGMFFSRWI